jgi:hypothetical protein
VEYLSNLRTVSLTHFLTLSSATRHINFISQTKCQVAIWIFADDTPLHKCVKIKKCWKEHGGFLLQNKCSCGYYDSWNLCTVSAKWCTIIFPAYVIEKLKNMQPRIFLLLHDYDSWHTANNKVTFLQNTLVQLLTHGTHSPDLVSWDLFLFPTLKDCLQYHQFSSF